MIIMMFLFYLQFVLQQWNNNGKQLILFVFFIINLFNFSYERINTSLNKSGRSIRTHHPIIIFFSKVTKKPQYYYSWKGHP